MRTPRLRPCLRVIDPDVARWLVIDPKPYVDDPAYDALQHMLNCNRLHADPTARRMAELLSLDPNRLLLWLFARCVQVSPDWPLPADRTMITESER